MHQATPLDLQRLRAVDWLCEVDHHEEIESTNDLAIARLRRGDIHAPALVIADAQTAGRGRGANRWWSGDGGLTFSLVFDAAGDGTSGSQRLDPQSWPRLALTAATAVATVLQQHTSSHSFGVRWPNDVFTEDRKISGILVEAPAVAARSGAMTSRSAAAKHLVVGIGLNVNNSIAAAPDDVRARAMSLIDLTGTPHDLTDVLLDLINQINSRLTRLATDDATLAAEWQQMCLLRGRTVTLAAGKRQVRGTCHGIQADGALAIETDGAVERFYGGVLSEVV
jgi:BirA family biotin operon repressor/biotin-[acetyl-CoA-carboxylase] ligase